MGRRVEMLNKKFGTLTVIEEAKERSKNGVIYWICKCSCGNIKNISGLSLRGGRSKSCGSPVCNPSTKKYQDINYNYFLNIKKRALKKNLEFNLSQEYIWELFLQQKRKCYLSGLDIILYPAGSRNRNKYQTASLDRIDSSRGYVEGNVSWCHKIVNSMKMNLNNKDFINWCEKIYKHNII